MSDVPPITIKLEDSDSDEEKQEESNTSGEDDEPQLHVRLGVHVNAVGHHNIQQQLPPQSPKSIMKKSNCRHRRSSTSTQSNGVSGMDSSSSSSYFNNHPFNVYPPQFYPFPPYHQMPFPNYFWPSSQFNPNQFPHLPGGGSMGGHQMNRTFSNRVDNNFPHFYPTSGQSHHSRQPEQPQKQTQHGSRTPSKKRPKVTFSSTATTFPSTVEGGTQTDDLIVEQQRASSGSNKKKRLQSEEGADAPNPTITATAQTETDDHRGGLHQDLGTRAVSPPPVKRGRGRKTGQKKEKK